MNKCNRLVLSEMVAAAVALMAAPTWALEVNALPRGGAVTQGSASIVQNTNAMTVNQGSQRAVIDWASYNVGSNASVRYVQPSSSSVVLNRVVGGDASQVLGRIDANGKVFLVNPNGVLFGAGAQVDANALLASTLDISNADFMAGRLKFAGRSNAGVTNQGRLTVDEGGYVALLGAKVSNSGTVSARLGSVAMAAGQAMTLDFAGDGLLNVQVDAGAVKATVDNGGMIVADGGSVLMSAKAAKALAGAVVNNTGVVQARTLSQHEGRIVLLGDMQSGSTQVAGTLDASAPQGGNGGFIETSAAQVKVAAGTKVTTLARDGRSGTWLIDPTDFTIGAGSGSQTSSGIGVDTLTAGLQAGNVSIATDAAGSEAGDIHVNAPVSWSADTTLTLDAHHDINFNAPVTASGNGAGLVLVAPGDYHVRSPITLSGANASLSINGEAYTLLRSMGDVAAMSGVVDGRFALVNDIDAAGTTYDRSIAAELTGVFTGLGHAIQNLTIRAPVGLDLPEAGPTALIEVAQAGSMVRDIGIINPDIYGLGSVAPLVGHNKGTVYNAYASGGAVTGEWAQSLGGLVGFNEGGTIMDSLASTNVFSFRSDIDYNRSSQGMGGLVGLSRNGRIENVHATGKVEGDFSKLGGLVGASDGDLIRFAHAMGEVVGLSFAGGLVGYASKGAISDSSATGNVSISGKFNSAGGLVGLSTSHITRSCASGNVSSSSNGIPSTGVQIGGLVGSNRGLIELSYATGNVTGGGGAIAGGLVGDNYSAINQSYSSGSVLSSLNANTGAMAGGLVGRLWSTGSISQSYSSGQVNALENVGGLVGSTRGGTGSVTDSYWNIDTSGQTTSAGGTGLTGAQMLQASSFTGWDLASTGGSSATWRIYEGQTSPLLRAFMPSLTLTVDNASKVYDGQAQFASGSYSASDPNANLGLVLGTGTYTAASKNAGTHALDLTGLYSSQQGYDLTIVSGTATITPKILTTNATADNKVYDGTNAATVHGYLTGIVAGDHVSLVQSGTFGDKNAAVGKLVNVTSTLTDSDAGNYVLASGGNVTADITPATLTVSGTSAKDEVYNGSKTATLVGASLGGRVAGDKISLVQRGSFSDKNAGTDKLVNYTNTLSGIDARNYVLADIGGSTMADITRAVLTVSGTTAANKVYNGMTSAKLSSGVMAGRVAGDKVSLVQKGSFGDKNVGTGKLVNFTNTLSGAGASNYVLADGNAQGTTHANITPAQLTARANDDTKVKDGVPYRGGNGVTFSGWVGGETDSVLTGTLRYGGTAQGAKLGGNYTLKGSGLVASNYKVKWIDGELTILPTKTPPKLQAQASSLARAIRTEARAVAPQDDGAANAAGGGGASCDSTSWEARGGAGALCIVAGGVR